MVDIDPIVPACGGNELSPCRTSTSCGSQPSVSAATACTIAGNPVPISCIPVSTVTRPLASMRILADDGPRTMSIVDTAMPQPTRS
jgi:hypothetical protein